VKISVVTISFNQADYLKECIESVLTQDCPDVEYIIVDPGSTDGSRAIIESYGAKIIRVFECDSGPADGLNKGFSHATGDIFCYINSDDTLQPGALRAVVNAFEKNQRVDVIYAHCNIVDEGGRIIRKAYSDRFSLKSSAYGASTIIQPSTFFRSSVFKAVGGFNVQNCSNWDGEFFIDLAILGFKTQRFNAVLSNYRVHSTGITGSGRLADLHLQYEERMFKKIMRRNIRAYDRLIAFFYRAKKHMVNPVATLERLRFGPVFSSKR
jgi:glycosyltransferase involved in cell wall biosynthesis